MEISHELKMKIITENKGINIEQHHNEIDVFWRTPIIPLYKEIKLTLNLKNDLDLLHECKRWFKASIDNCFLNPKVDIGCFKGLFPVEISIDNIVIFTADEFNNNNENWKDWFVMEEE